VRRNGMKRAGAVVLAPDGRHLIVAAPDSSAVHVFAVKLKPPKVTVTGSFRRASADLRIGCPKTAMAWCAGTVRLKTRKAAPFFVRPGKRLRVVLSGKGLHGRVPITAVSSEPWGAKATTRKTLRAP
jgi:hypothetical protein